ncbi:VWA domain-containing protein [Melioribacteraceae bacterium 4301-Me]|uniref:vWA domain-containing protein n=1 Tax=Pyranulibacter aquaticus TaxID=3163344 RepID=UPI003599198F
MFRFAHPEFLYLFLLLPIMIGLYWLTFTKQNKMLSFFIGEKLHKILFPNRSIFKSHLKFFLTLFAFSLLIFAFANPQIGTKIEDVKQVGIDVYICLDVSLSMTAEDVKPNRLEKAKYEISQLMQKLNGDRIGLIIFAGQAYVQFPLTSDYSAANLFLSAVNTNSVPQPGTAIASAIELATKSFNYNDQTKKAIIVITDGEDHEGDIDKAVDEAVSKDIMIYTIGFGSPTGVPIPIYDSSGNQIGYKKDAQGNIVLTKLDQSILQEIAQKGNGKFYLGSNNQDELDKIYKDLSNIEKSEYGTKKITDYEDRFYYLLFLALLILIVEFFIPLNKSKLFARLESISEKK